jgi:hypothetical protein
MLRSHPRNEEKRREEKRLRMSIQRHNIDGNEEELHQSKKSW